MSIYILCASWAQNQHLAPNHQLGGPRIVQLASRNVWSTWALSICAVYVLCLPGCSVFRDLSREGRKCMYCVYLFKNSPSVQPRCLGNLFASLIFLCQTINLFFHRECFNCCWFSCNLYYTHLCTKVICNVCFSMLTFTYEFVHKSFKDIVAWNTKCQF